MRSLLYIITGGILGCLCKQEDSIKVRIGNRLHVRCMRCNSLSEGVEIGFTWDGVPFQYNAERVRNGKTWVETQRTAHA